VATSNRSARCFGGRVIESRVLSGEEGRIDWHRDRMTDSLPAT
jgi:hypothetical protein